MSDRTRYRFIFAVNGILAVIALVDIWWGMKLAKTLTVRDIRIPSTVYSVPYHTHGATVFITKAENFWVLAGWVLTALLVATQLGLNNLRKKR